MKETTKERLEPSQERLGQWQEHLGPITRSMAKRINEDLDQTTDGRERVICICSLKAHQV